jgi:hypothetical protein
MLVVCRWCPNVVESLKAVTPMLGFTAYQTLLKSYISEGLRRDEAQFDQHTVRRLAYDEIAGS